MRALLLSLVLVAQVALGQQSIIGGGSAETIGRQLYTRTSAEIAAGITPTRYRYPELNVLRYGADATGATDATTAFNNARLVAVQKGSGEIIVPAGRYAVNLVVTGLGIHYRSEIDNYDGSGAVAINAFSPTSPAIQVGDGSATTRGITFTGFHVAGTGGADQGIRIYGASRVKFERLSVRAFEQYQIQLDSSATVPTSHIYFERLDLATSATAGALGIDYNYGGTSTTAVFISDSALTTNAGGSHVIDLEDSCQLRVTNSWITPRTLQGIRFRGTNSRLIGHGAVVDSGSSSDVVIEFDFDDFVGDELMGGITVDGVARMTSGDTASLAGKFWIPRNTMARELHVQTSLNFQDSSAALNTQHAAGTLNQRIVRAGTTLEVRSDSGTVNLIGTNLQANGVDVARVVTGSFTITLTGCTANPTATAEYYIISNSSANSSVVTLMIPSMSCTSNATTATLTGLPAAIQPSAQGGIQTCVPLRNNTASVNGDLQLQIGSPSIITLGATCASHGSAFTASGTKGTDGGGPIVITYPLT